MFEYDKEKMIKLLGEVEFILQNIKIKELDLSDFRVGFLMGDYYVKLETSIPIFLSYSDLNEKGLLKLLKKTKKDIIEIIKEEKTIILLVVRL